MLASAPGAVWRLVPAVFVLIWSTGFIVARYGMPHAPPMGFLAWRYVLSIACFGAWIALSGARWPQGRAAWGHLAVTGLLMQAGYLGGVWAAVRQGLGAGAIALIVGLQPVLTALWLASRGAPGGGGGGAGGGRVSPGQWAGLGLGLAGLALVVGRKLGQGEVTALNFALALLALGSITVGTLYQKRFVAPCDARTAGFVQMLAALTLTLPLALLETAPITWHPEMAAALAWSVLGLTLGASSLLYLMIQRGEAAAVTSWLYLVPPTTALMAAALFGEPLGLDVLIGTALTAAGVALVQRAAR